ncbi:MAG: hypothetical protein PHX08_06385 [Lachnospiraceae bacterium]|nr:hypothetical protein [Lachnospiraceae bacterium]
MSKSHGLVSKQGIPALKQDYDKMLSLRYISAVADETAQSVRQQSGF